MIYLLFFLTLNLHASTVPENTLEIPVSAFQEGGITEQDFDSSIAELEAIYAPQVAREGATLIIEKYWPSKTVNAFARRFEENEWRIMFFGGMARHKHMTRDGFSLIICHELGHHLGGEPKFQGDVAWSSTEGQADYYSAADCLQTLWSQADNARNLKDVPASLIAQCETETNEDLCQRVGMAGLSAARLFSTLTWFQPLPKFETPDTNVVTVSNGGHPKAQCRLDTYLQGALINPRPACWYKSR
jgi:hypothetical protein